MRIERLVIPAVIVLAGCTTTHPDPVATASERCAPYVIAGEPGVTPPTWKSGSMLPEERPSIDMAGRPASGESAWACLAYTVNSKGRVENVEVVATSSPVLGARAARGLSATVYEPARKNGEPVPFRSMRSVAIGGGKGRLGSDGWAPDSWDWAGYPETAMPPVHGVER
jgi:hypothetical protein